MADPLILPKRLCLFTRAPEPDRVKTRLAEEIGAAGALEAHIRLVEHTLLQVTGRSGFQIELWIAGALDNSFVTRWVARFGLRLHAQQGADLGERMRRALFPVAGSGGGVLIGTDCPDIDAAYLDAAFDALLEADVVLGPAEDGGYGLIGLRRDAPTLFESIPWSSSKVLSATLAQAERAGLRAVCLPKIWDVDRGADWQRFIGRANSQSAMVDRLSD